MFLDASAIVAILTRESDAAALAARLDQALEVRTSPVAIYETVLGLARIGNMSIDDAEVVLDRFLEEVDARVISIDAETGREALKAFGRFGKGRHPAQLNMGDCFAYACAQRLGAALLFKGGDFPLTDVKVA